MKSYKKRSYTLWDYDIRLSKLSKLGDPLELLRGLIDFEVFRNLIDEGFVALPDDEEGEDDICYDHVLMFKILILQHSYGLTDEQTEFHINDRMSFMRFLSADLSDDMPDSQAICRFREQFTKSGLWDKLFQLFLDEAQDVGLEISGDATKNLKLVKHI
jgi:hypothetical protein